MTRNEFTSWMAFFELYPFDDYARFYRPAALVAHSMGGADINALLNWLVDRPTDAPTAAPTVAPVPIKYTAADLATFKTFGMKPPGMH